jgi:uncharacterized membrane protein
MLQLISLVLLIFSFFIIQTSMPALPKYIPTHFNAAGVANAWGSPNILWILLGAQALTSVVFLIVPYLGQLAPGAIHVGTRRLNDFSPAQRTHVLSMLNNMAAYMSIVMNLFFVLMLMDIIRAAAQPIPHIHPLLPLALLIGGAFGILFYYTMQFRRAAKGEDGRESQDKFTS